MRSNRLQLNSDETQVMWCTTDRRQHQLPTAALPIDGVPIDPVSFVRDLGIYIDADLVMRTHVMKTASQCFAVLRHLRQISLDRPSCLPVTESAVGLRSTPPRG